LREIREETGVLPKTLVLAAESPDWLVYELPETSRSAKTGRGQVQKWRLLRFLGSVQVAQTAS
jgi:putative (di)nucleoside polyphosphate hydrolase